MTVVCIKHIVSDLITGKGAEENLKFQKKCPGDEDEKQKIKLVRYKAQRVSIFRGPHQAVELIRLTPLQNVQHQLRLKRY